MAIVTYDHDLHIILGCLNHLGMDALDQGAGRINDGQTKLLGLLNRVQTDTVGRENHDLGARLRNFA